MPQYTHFLKKKFNDAQRKEKEKKEQNGSLHDRIVAASHASSS